MGSGWGNTMYKKSTRTLDWKHRKNRDQKKEVRPRACLRWRENTDEPRLFLHHGFSCLPTPPAGGPRRSGRQIIFPSASKAPRGWIYSKSCATERAGERLLGSAGGEESGRSGMETDGFVERKQATPVGWGKKNDGG
jgi:hypothetical protein